MKFGICTLDDFDVSGKVVLCRVDINQPVDQASGTLKSIARIEASVPTIKELSDRGAKVVILAHQGSDIEYKNFYSTQPHSEVLTKLLGRPVQWIDDVCGPAARQAIKSLKNGQILMLDNVRFCSEEQTLFELKLRLSHEEQTKTQLVQKLTPLADLYVCDAFAAVHRSQPSLCALEQVLPSSMGRLFENEYSVLSELMESPKRPCVFILGGAKIADAFMMMNTVLERKTADFILTGGVVGNIILASMGEEIGKGSMNYILKSNYKEFIETAKLLYSRFSGKIVAPLDLAGVTEGIRYEYDVGDIPADFMALDIGKKTAQAYISTIKDAKTVFMNGPMGVFEEQETGFGTEAILKALADSSAFTVIGGGDSITAATKYGIVNKIVYVCTGGGAMIRFLAGEELPVIKALRESARRQHDGDKA